MRRMANWVAGLGVVAMVAGCARDMKAPDEFKRLASVASGHTASGDYKEHFKPIGNILISGKAQIRGTTFSDLQRCDFTFFAAEPGQSRLFLHSDDKGTLLDVIRRSSILTVVAEQTGYVYQGEIESSASPFTKAWGFEPGDIYHALTVGQTVAAERTSSEGIVDLQTRHALPELVRWRRGEQEFIARYFAWEYAANAGVPEASEKRLIPTKFQIGSPATGVVMTLTVRSATFDQPPQESLFTPTLNYRARRATLRNLEAALTPR